MSSGLPVSLRVKQLFDPKAAKINEKIVKKVLDLRFPKGAPLTRLSHSQKLAAFKEDNRSSSDERSENSYQKHYRSQENDSGQDLKLKSQFFKRKRDYEIEIFDDQSPSVMNVMQPRNRNHI
jgi:hypothetical protein